MFAEPQVLRGLLDYALGISGLTAWPTTIPILPPNMAAALRLELSVHFLIICDCIQV